MKSKIKILAGAIIFGAVIGSVSSLASNVKLKKEFITLQSSNKHVLRWGDERWQDLNTTVGKGFGSITDHKRYCLNLLKLKQTNKPGFLIRCTPISLNSR